MKEQKEIGVRAVRVKTGVKADDFNPQHNETMVHDLPWVRGMRVKTGVKAGAIRSLATNLGTGG